jgi:hypothetical protein
VTGEPQSHSLHIPNMRICRFEVEISGRNRALLLKCAYSMRYISIGCLVRLESAWE